jgi:hypothetical protein
MKHLDKTKDIFMVVLSSSVIISSILGELKTYIAPVEKTGK